jgi:AraC family transcriptional regulator of adaptative response / DNA-3-methyladenine glycosylase II
VRALAGALHGGQLALRGEQPLEEVERALVAVPGIGPWTAQYIAMRALGHPDAFPAADLVLRRVAGDGRSLTARELALRADAWRPWRAYAVMLLWRSA